LMHQAKIGVWDGRELELKQEVEDINERQSKIKETIRIIEQQIERIPDPEHIKQLSKIGQGIHSVIMRNPMTIVRRPYEWKRKLIEHSFGGNDSGERPLGVYVDHDEEKRVKFEIRARFGTQHLPSPVIDEQLMDYFIIDPQYCDAKKEVDKIRHILKQVSARELG